MINKNNETSECGAITDMHMNKLYGYLIDSSVLYLPIQQHLISNRGEVCHLRNTMSELLHYLMQHADKGIITDDEIIFNVWEKNELSGTYSRLWQVMQDLRKNLDKVGIDNELFMRVRGKGYYLMNEKITPLYTRTNRLNRVIDRANKNYSSL